MEAPLVYVVVINWNGEEHLDACFSSLLASTYGNTVFLLVDNASTDGSVQFVQERFGSDGRVQILALDENRGWSGGNNAGIRRALEEGAGYLFLLNNDTATDPEAIRLLVERMEGVETLGALAPRMVLFDQPEVVNSVGLRLSVIGAAWDIGIGRIDGERWHTYGPIAGVCGGACFLRAAAVQRAGLLPESFEIYLDDLDLCLRIWEAGFTVEACPEAVVRHKFSATMGAGPWVRRKYYLNTRNRFRILMRHFPLKSAFDVLPRLVVGELRALGRGMLSGAWWRVPAHVRAWFSSVAYVPAALRFRQAHRVARAVPAFWPMVVRSPLFCPALQLPEDGWYPPVQHAGRLVRPMARRAWAAVPAGTLQVLLVNCYPGLGDARISLYLDETPLGQLDTATMVDAYYETAGGMLVAVAESIFELEDTGAPADVGAWLQLTCGDSPLL